MSANSESRKRIQLEQARRERIESFCRLVERRREVTQQALERIMDGATFDDADAFLIGLDDLGASVVVGDS
jgi:hypothetical protein